MVMLLKYYSSMLPALAIQAAFLVAWPDTDWSPALPIWIAVDVGLFFVCSLGYAVRTRE